MNTRRIHFNKLLLINALALHNLPVGRQGRQSIKTKKKWQHQAKDQLQYFQLAN